MIRPQKESIRYSLLLILLLATAAIAVAVTINLLDVAVPDDGQRLMLTIVIWTLTMGFMLIAGAFGLWAVHFSAEAESLRRISLLVDHMNDIRDGILAVDRQGKIIGMNAAAQNFFGPVKGKPIREACSAISEAELTTMLQSQKIIEREYPQQVQDEKDGPDRLRTLRLRIQPAVTGGIALILVSDITRMAAARAKQRRTASLQLAGHMAQGIANDFNDLLCGISGHAALLEKPQRSPENQRNSTRAIQQCADRGIRLARQLIQLSQAQQETATNITTQVAKHVANGADVLESNLDPTWTIDCQTEQNIPPVNMPPSQIEHFIHSLGLIVSETLQTHTKLITIILRSPTNNERTKNGSRVAAVLEIKRNLDSVPQENRTQSPPPLPEDGIISSLVHTLILQAGGQFEALPDGRRAHHFCLYLPEVDANTLLAGSEEEEPLAIGLEAYTAGWHILVCMQVAQNPYLQTYLEKKNITVHMTHDENAFLQALTTSTKYEVIFIQPDILGQHFQAIVPIVNRICPDSATVLLMEHAPDNILSDVIKLSPSSSPARWIHAMIDARSRRIIALPAATP